MLPRQRYHPRPPPPLSCLFSNTRAENRPHLTHGYLYARQRTRRQRLVIYQRNKDRRLLELDDNMAVLRELLGPKWEVAQIVHDNAHEPCWLYSQLMDADMLLTPHG